jgi:hypothetical protein
MSNTLLFGNLGAQAQRELLRVNKRESWMLATFSDAGLLVSVRSFRDEIRAEEAYERKCADTENTIALYTRNGSDAEYPELVYARLSPISDLIADADADEVNATLAKLQAPKRTKRESTQDAQRVAIAASDSSASHVANASDKSADTRTKGSRKMTKKNSGISHAAIIAAVASNPNRVNQTAITSVVHAERVASIDEHKLIAADGTKLYAYVNASGVLTCETQAEMKERKSARAARKQANKVGMLSTESARVANAASAPDIHAASNARIAEVAQADAIAQALELLRSAGIDVQTIASAPAQTASANARKSAPKVAQTASAPATRGRAQNEREIATICNYLDKLNMTRTKFEKSAKVNLDALAVQALRDIKAQLREQIASKQS